MCPALVRAAHIANSRAKNSAEFLAGRVGSGTACCDRSCEKGLVQVTSELKKTFKKDKVINLGLKQQIVAGVCSDVH